ncbi:MAG: methyltransferase domain-containing protein [Terracidiphilus sp.]
MRKIVSNAIQTVKEAFPFQRYMDHTQYSCANIATTVLRHVPIGSKILDFGSGPCDKTATLSVLGYRCSAIDELKDDWHLEPGNREKILSFAAQMGIDLYVSTNASVLETDNVFDLVMMNDVIEHLHQSPRRLLNELLEKLKPNGLLLITVPNAVNIRKRLDVMLGRTNYPPFESFFWYDEWRGHVREYTRHDLESLAELLGIECRELRACDHMIDKVPYRLRWAYKSVTSVATAWKDSWLLLARKPAAWSPACTPAAPMSARYDANT